MAGLDRNGFKRKTYDDLLTDLSNKARQLFGENINLTPRSFFGIIIRLFAWALDLIWQLAEKTYNSSFMSKAEGIQLDRKAWEFGISRLTEQNAQGTIEIRGNSGYVVEEGTLFETESGILFELTEDVTLNENGVGTGYIYCTEAGTKGNVAANTVVILSEPDENITSVTNPEPITGGRDRETDAEFVDRYQQTLPGLGSTNTDSVRGELLKLNGVRAAVVIENDESTPDEEGRPPHSISAYVLGGNPDEIAQAIFKKKAGGIKTHGTEEIQVLDMAGNPHTVRFSWVTEVPIEIQLTIKKNDSFPADGIQQIKTQIIKYIGGADADGTFYIGLNAGETVTVFKIIKQLDKIDGIDDAELLVGIKGETLGTENIPMGMTQVAQISHEDIEVQVT